MCVHVYVYVYMYMYMYIRKYVYITLKSCYVGGHLQVLLLSAAGLPREIFQGFCGSHPSAAPACSWA